MHQRIELFVKSKTNGWDMTKDKEKQDTQTSRAENTDTYRPPNACKAWRAHALSFPSAMWSFPFKHIHVAAMSAFGTNT